MRCFVWCLVLCGLLAACRQPSAEEQAARQACQCYEALFAGSYDTFLDGRAGMDALPPSLRQQFAEAMQQFAARQQARGGVVSVSSSRACYDASLGVMQVFLLLTFGDGSAEEIVVPMVLVGDRWMLK